MGVIEARCWRLSKMSVISYVRVERHPNQQRSIFSVREVNLAIERSSNRDDYLA
jgi:hypothetical protein